MLVRENIIKRNLYESFNSFNFKEISNIPKINLRGNINDQYFVNNIKTILEIALPITPNTNNSNNKLRIIWLSPNEWMIEIYEKKDFDKIFVDLKNSLSPENTATTDITESKTTLKLTGPNLYKLLSKFMIIDLEKTLKNKSAVAQTIFIKVPVLIVQNHNENINQSIYLYTNRSYAEYIINLLIDGTKNINF